MRLLHNRSFILLLLGNFVSRTGTVIYNIALSWWITTQTGSTVAIGYILGASTIGTVLALPISGVIVDYFNKKKILIVTDSISAIAGIWVSILIYREVENTFLYIVASFILGLCSSIFKPAVKAIVPYIVHKEDFVKANSLSANIGEISKIIGPGVAAILMSAFPNGAAISIFLDGISFGISAISEVFIKADEPNKEGRLKKSSFVNDFLDGFSYLKDNKTILNIIMLSTVANIFIASFDIVLPAYVYQIIHEDEITYSNMLIFYAVGGMCVTLFMFFVKNIELKISKLYKYTAAIGVIFAILSFGRNRMFLYVVVAVFGAVLGYFNTIFMSYVQLNVSEEFIGRIFSIVFSLALAGTPISYVVYGYLGEKYLEMIFFVSGVLIFATALIFFAISFEPKRIHR